MNLIRLTYTSVAVSSFTTDDLREVVAKSQRNNSRDGVTGFLTYSAPVFTQSLEGRRDAVQGVYKRIAADPRHGDLRVLALRDIDCREFGDWSMELVHLDEEAIAAVAPVLDRKRAAPETRPDAAVEERLVRLVRGLYPRAVNNREAATSS